MNECAKKGCFQPVTTETDRSKPSTLHKVYIDEIEHITVTFETVSHSSGLCYLHLKQAQGLFDCKFPLSKFGQPNEQETVMQFAFKKAFKVQT
jgi:hypothetical protein